MMFGTKASSLRVRLSSNPASIFIKPRTVKVVRGSKDDAVRRARKIQVLLAILAFGFFKLLASALQTRPQVTTLFMLWLVGVIFFVVTEANGTLHASQKTENKFWMAMSSLLSAILLFIANDSPLKIDVDAEGLVLGLCIIMLTTYVVHVIHKRSHRQSLEKRSAIPKNRSYREAISALAEEQTSLDGLVAEVNDALSKLESALIPGGFRRMFDRESMLQSEKKIIDCFSYATRAQLNYLVLHVNMNVVLYRLKNHSNRKQTSELQSRRSSEPPTPTRANTPRRSYSPQPEDSVHDGQEYDSILLSGAPTIDEESSEDADISRDSEGLTARPASMGSYFDDDSVEVFMARRDLRNALVELLAQERLNDLTTSARASVLDAIQVIGMMRNPLTKERAQRWAANIILDTKGDQLSELKTITDAKGSVHSMHKLVYNDITDEAIRASLLSHFQANKRTRLGRKVLSDVDDTLVCSGGRYPAGIDAAYPVHCVYPGAGSFYEALDRGVSDTFAPPGVYGSKADMDTDDSESDTDDWLQAHYRENDNRSKANAKKRVVVGNLVFLSARPHVYKDMAERRVYQKFEKLIRARNLHAMPTLLPGDLESGQAYMFRGDFEPMARKKLRNMVEYHSIYPEFTHVFVCDNGQADVRAAELMKERLGASLEAVYVHQVQPIDKTFGYNEGSLVKWTNMGIVFYKTFVGAATDACKRGFVEPASLRQVCVSAVAEFVELSTVHGGRFPGGLVGIEERRLELTTDLIHANELLISLTLPDVPAPRSLCMFPVGSTVHTRVFGEGFVRAFRPVDGVYEVALLRGSLIGYFTAIDLRNTSWGKGHGGLFLGHHLNHSNNDIQVGCKVNTPYGEGVVRRYRPSDEVFEVILTKWPALAFLREESVEKATTSNRIRRWGTLGQAFLRRTFSSAPKGGSPPLKPHSVPPALEPSPGMPETLNQVGQKVYVHPFGNAVVIKVAREEDSIVSVKFENIPNGFGFVHLSNLQPEKLPKEEQPIAIQVAETPIVTPRSGGGSGGGGFHLAPVAVAARVVGALVSWSEKLKAGTHVETPYGKGVVAEAERSEDQIVKVRLDWGADAYCHPSQIRKMESTGMTSRILTLLSRHDSSAPSSAQQAPSSAGAPQPPQQVVDSLSASSSASSLPSFPNYGLPTSPSPEPEEEDPQAEET